MEGYRLDAAMADRGLVRSRTQAARVIAAGLVTVDGKPAVKASAVVTERSYIEIAELDHYVSRAAHKLIAALDSFAVSPSDRLVLDVGASTGGFTQVLLERGARGVIALDVGHGQLASSLRSDSRVRVVEGFNARAMTAASLASESRVSEVPSMLVADLSFISLTMVLPALAETLGSGAEYVVLVKPQFEVGRGGIREGVVKSAALRDEAIMNVLWAAWDLGLGTAGIVPSPIAGTAGNQEYLVWLSAAAGSNPTEWVATVGSIA